MSKLRSLLLIVVLSITLTSCKKEPLMVESPLTFIVTQEETPVCEYNSAEYTTDEIEIITVSSDNSDIFGDIGSFTNPCKTSNINPIVFANATLKSYVFEISFDAIYPVENLVITNYIDVDEIAIKQLDISISLDGVTYIKLEDDLLLSNTSNKETIVQFNNQLAKFIKFSIKSEVGTGNYGSDFFGLNDISVFLGEGMIVKEATEWTEAFTRYDGWTGADGIFSFNLESGNDSIGVGSNSTLFLFSDTILGNVNPETSLRLNPEFLNNTIGYFNGNNSDIFNNMEFIWNEENGIPSNIFVPDAYIGYHPSNLINHIGLYELSLTETYYDYTVTGSSWLSAAQDENPSVVIDFLDVESLTEMNIFNFVENVDYSTTSIKVSYSLNNFSFNEVGTYGVSIPEQSTSISPSLIGGNTSLDLTGINARYIKIEFLDNNTTLSNQVGLGKIIISNESKELYGIVTATSYDETINTGDSHSRLWLQDGVVIDDYFYTFPLIVKDYDAFFKVFKIGLIKIHIVNNQLDLDSIEYIDAPLQNEMYDNSITYYGAGVNNQDTSGGLLNQDGYIYIYGYKDSLGRYLTIARVEEENFENFNKWTYFNGTSWSDDINAAAPLINGVSPELSVTYLDEGIHVGEYMLVVMKNTTSGLISLSYSDTPYGPWTELETVYIASAIRNLPGAFAYNAKLHPHLSEKGKYLVSYNVNTTSLTVMTNGEIYHPRFIWLIETKQKP